MFELDLEKAEEPQINRQHLFNLQKARELHRNIYFIFMDNAKDLDWLDHSKLWKILKEMGTPDLLTCFLRNL